jgi:hypothetical protein
MTEFSGRSGPCPDTVASVWTLPGDSFFLLKRVVVSENIPRSRVWTCKWQVKFWLGLTYLDSGSGSPGSDDSRSVGGLESAILEKTLIFREKQCYMIAYMVTSNSNNIHMTDSDV